MLCLISEPHVGLAVTLFSVRPVLSITHKTTNIYGPSLDQISYAFIDNDPTGLRKCFDEGSVRGGSLGADLRHGPLRPSACGSVGLACHMNHGYPVLRRTLATYLGYVENI
ncbi:hypothetical protein F5884DRAFT_340598 [Xylogone sp. PMI_703]|nr:hypothetical protein F5884DRAFT_340598 [Xylogone sp. PMI_703]